MSRRWVLFLLVFFAVKWAFGEGDKPPFSIADPAIERNFQEAFDELGALRVRGTNSDNVQAALHVSTITVTNGITFSGSAPDTPAANTAYQKSFFNVLAGVNANCTESWSVNVDSFTAVGTGQCRVNFDVNFTDTHYACFVSVLDASSVRFHKINDTTITTGGVEVIIFDAAGVVRDEPFWIGCVGAQ